MLQLANDGTEDEFVHCLKKGQPRETGKQKLNSQLLILVDESDVVSPFISPSDEENANKQMNVIEDKTDEEIIMWIKIFSITCLVLKKKATSTVLEICK